MNMRYVTAMPSALVLLALEIEQAPYEHSVLHMNGIHIQVITIYTQALKHIHPHRRRLFTPSI